MYTPDIIKTGFVTEYPNDKKEKCQCGDDRLIEDATQMYIEALTTSYAGFLWDSMFSREIIGEKRFDENLKWCEDHIFSFELFSQCKKVVFLNSITYHYMADQSNSLSNVKDAQIIYDAAVKEYKVDKNLAKDNKKANRLNDDSYLRKIAYMIEVLYKNYSFYERKEFKTSHPILSNLEIKDLPTKFYYSSMPASLSNIAIKAYHILKMAKSKIKR